MKRRLFTILSALSLLLFVSVVVMWVRTNVVQDYIGFEASRPTGTRIYGIASRHGLLWVGRMDDPSAETSAGTQRYYWRTSPSSPGMRGNKLPLSVQFGGEVEGARQWGVQVPYLLLMLLLGIAPARWYFSWKRTTNKQLHGLCPSCGYDLCATPDRCPECGATPAKA